MRILRITPDLGATKTHNFPIEIEMMQVSTCTRSKLTVTQSAVTSH